MPRTLIALAAGSALLAMAACASGPRSEADERRGDAGALALNPAGLMLAGCDADFDYRIGPEELEPCIARAFAAADRNGDGALSLIELGDWRQRAFGHGEALPGPYAFDASQDGSVSQAEFAAAIQAQAASYADADGAIPFSALARQIERLGRGAGQPGEFRLERRDSAPF